MRKMLWLPAALALAYGPAQASDNGAAIPPPKPKYDVRIERSVMVPMRDGVELSTDLYMPVDATGPLPVVLMRTPYGKSNFRATRLVHFSPAHVFASQGFAVAVQDTRGRWESQGQYTVLGNDGPDGYDTITWLAEQSWSNGNVGMYGCSYLGEVQMIEAKYRHPALKAMIPQAAASNGTVEDRYRFFSIWNGGVTELAIGSGWFYGNGMQVFYQPPKWLTHEAWLTMADYFQPGPQLPDIDMTKYWLHLPVVDIVEAMGAPPNEWKELISKPLSDPYWKALGLLAKEDEPDVPALHINSWYDFGPVETLVQFNHFREKSKSEGARDNQFAVISPVTHCVSEIMTAETIVGDRPVGDPRLDYWGLYLDWFGHWLAGEANGVTARPKLAYYLMGENRWKSANAWPVEGTTMRPLYLRSGGNANSRFGDGALSFEPPGAEPADGYVYDPRTPVPTYGGPLCCTGDPPDARPGALDQREIEMRHDVLVYSTPPLEAGIEVTGPLTAVIFVSSNARDTDFTAKLVDVYPDGTAYNLQDGILRARYREGFERAVFMQEGDIYRLEIDLQATSNYFGPGHRIRLEISSSNFPRFARNLNTGGNSNTETEWRVAENSVHHSRGHASHIVLPVVTSE